MFMPRNSTSILFPFYVQDLSSSVGAGLSGLTYTTSLLTCYYHRDIDAAPTIVPLTNLTVGTYNASGFAPISPTVAPGDYQFGVPNICWAGTGNFTTITLFGAANMLPIKTKFLLTDAGLGYIANSGITNNSYANMIEPTTVPTWPMNIPQAIGWMTARSINKTITTTDITGSGGGDVVYKSDNVTTIGSGVYNDNGTAFQRNKYQ